MTLRGGSEGLPASALSFTKDSNKDGGAIDDAGGSGVPARDCGDAEPVDNPDDSLLDLGCLCPGGGVPFSDLGESKRLWRTTCQKRLLLKYKIQVLTFFFADWPEFLTRFLLLITSVLRLIGLARPWSLRKSPQALHSTDPASSLLHNGVVEVVQF